MKKLDPPSLVPLEVIPFLLENVALLMQNTKRVFCHILLECATVKRHFLLEMVLSNLARLGNPASRGVNWKGFLTYMNKQEGI